MAIINEQFFDSKDAMTEHLASILESTLNSALEGDSGASMLVSGGSSPAPAYKRLSSLDLDWSKVTVAMVDERWVSPSHEKSNEAFIQNTLLQEKASRAQFVTMKNSASTAVLGQDEVEARYQTLKAPFDVTILGMGPDGHTASLFPHAEGLDAALETEQLVCAINANESEVTGSITERMSLTLAGIANTQHAILLISGEEKRAMYEQAKQQGSELDIPLRAVLGLPDLKLSVFWCP
ncbi:MULTISPECIES: 6-phosphogluconolactonase [Pseudoalteromonas]|uniref:6-phosphogluconolactonase n=1 Tax=Pseudoalteromonas luteoviolacea (strain 2ta16) TaxID=1353533 RepID=V4HMB9_PSEL2|nr:MULTISPECIES: 6-phosphogluconolactonase [Pseudoalteromonas]ESP90888.1 6-phosphogluconolactonase [Pseudoalteromonas luteoviolacea 2ta16]KZN38355.1 6-phosphogluconolactonase [Pseudoalteromonas luteoviolacea NCIMB 1944]MCG7547785.1 6-phosphogluconolactonase [Pseudoalteromonas sp. Of7M-16]